MMGNYLGKLVERHLNRLEVLQPLLPSLFEPLPVHMLSWQPRNPPNLLVDESVLHEASAQTRTPSAARSATANIDPDSFSSRRSTQRRLSAKPLPKVGHHALQTNREPEEASPLIRPLDQSRWAPVEPETFKPSTASVVISEARTSRGPKKNPPAPAPTRAERESTHRGHSRKSKTQKTPTPVSRTNVPAADENVTIPTPSLAAQPKPALSQISEHRKVIEKTGEGSKSNLVAEVLPARTESAPPVQSSHERKFPDQTAEPTHTLERVKDLPVDHTTRIKRTPGNPEVAPRANSDAPPEHKIHSARRSPFPSAEDHRQVSASPSPPVIIQQQLTRYVRAPAPPLVEPLTASEPIINVTIGRIEVRATSTPEPARHRERTEQQVLSLDRYLSQRAKGRMG